MVLLCLFPSLVGSNGLTYIVVMLLSRCLWCPELVQILPARLASLALVACHLLSFLRTLLLLHQVMDMTLQDLGDYLIFAGNEGQQWRISWAKKLVQ